MVKAPNDTSAAAQDRGNYRPELLQPEDNQLLLYENSPFAERSKLSLKSTHHIYRQQTRASRANWQSGYVCQEANRQATSSGLRRI